MRALWLTDVLAHAGLEVIEQPGWRERGKELVAVEGVVVHHTASPPNSTLATNLAVVTNGNSVAPGPIANLLLWRDGTFYVIAAGRANHAGAGGPWGWLPEGQANLRTIGIEAVNSGVGELWSNEMLDAYELGTAAILAAIGADASHTLTHNEWAPLRKIDPAGPTSGRIATLPGRQTWSGNAWRTRVLTRLLDLTPPPPPPAPEPAPPTEDDDMALPAPQLIRFRGYANELLFACNTFTHGTAEQIETWRTLYGDTAHQAFVWEAHPQAMKGAFTKAGLDVDVDAVKTPDGK